MGAYILRLLLLMIPTIVVIMAISFIAASAAEKIAAAGQALVGNIGLTGQLGDH
ncbi:microcin ABC transporter permease, partial [Rhizobium ruizarguesonis]